MHRQKRRFSILTRRLRVVHVIEITLIVLSNVHEDLASVLRYVNTPTSGLKLANQYITGQGCKVPKSRTS